MFHKTFYIDPILLTKLSLRILNIYFLNHKLRVCWYVSLELT